MFNDKTHWDSNATATLPAAGLLQRRAFRRQVFDRPLSPSSIICPSIARIYREQRKIEEIAGDFPSLHLILDQLEKTSGYEAFCSAAEDYASMFDNYILAGQAVCSNWGNLLNQAMTSERYARYRHTNN